MFSNRWKTLAWTAAAVLVLGTLIVIPSAWAAAPPGDVHDKFRNGNTVVIGANETVPHDLYVTANTVRVDGRIDGDLFVAAGTIDINGPVSGDLYLAGGTITLSGPVTGDAAIGGGNVTISNTVGRHLRVGGGNVAIGSAVQLDLLAGAGTLTLHRDARVGGDLIFSAGQMTLDGNVAGGVLGSASTYTKTGTITGAEDVRITVSQPAPAPRTGQRLLGQLQRYLGILLVGALLLAVVPRFVLPAAARLRERPLASLGFGVLGVVVFLPALVALFVGMVLIAIPLGMLGLGRVVLAVVVGVLVGSAALSFAFMLVLLFIAAVVVGLTLGQVSFERAGVHVTGATYLALAFGTLLIVVLTALPVVGWLVQLAVVCTGLGALLLTLRWHRARMVGSGPTPPVAGSV